MNRDPIDVFALRNAARKWLEAPQDDPLELSEADIELEAELLRQGMMNPEEAIDRFEAEPESDFSIGTVVVYLESGEHFRI